MKRFHHQGRIQDLLIENAGTKSNPATDTSLMKKLEFSENNLHSAASRSMRQDPFFHAGMGPNGEWIYYRDESRRNRLIDTPKKHRNFKPKAAPLSGPKNGEQQIPVLEKSEVTDSHLYFVLDINGAPVRVQPDAARKMYAQLKSVFE